MDTRYPMGYNSDMPIIAVTLDSYQSVTSAPGIVLLDCWAEWCPPCRAFKPIFEEAANNYSDITFGLINTEEETDLAAQLVITSIPTVMAFRDGILVYAQPGALGARDLARVIEAVQNLDMEKVRAEVESSDTPDSSTLGD